MKLQPGDVIGYQGQDHLVEGILNFSLAGKVYLLARTVVPGGGVVWFEPPLTDLDDRVVFLREVTDLGHSIPPPATISYRGGSYLLRLSGRAQVDAVGHLPERAPGPVEVWRYRAAGDLHLHVEEWSDRVVVLAGESVHKDMLDVMENS